MHCSQSETLMAITYRYYPAQFYFLQLINGEEGIEEKIYEKKEERCGIWEWNDKEKTKEARSRVKWADINWRRHWSLEGVSDVGSSWTGWANRSVLITAIQYKQQTGLDLLQLAVLWFIHTHSSTRNVAERFETDSSTRWSPLHTTSWR